MTILVTGGAGFIGSNFVLEWLRSGEIAKSLTPSKRGELEMADVNRNYLANNSLDVFSPYPGMVWLDSGPHDPLLETGHFVRAIEQRQALKMCPSDENSRRAGWISPEELDSRATPLRNSGYGNYVLSLLTQSGLPT